MTTEIPKYKVFSFKTITGENVLAELHSADQASSTVNLLYPIKVDLIPTQVRDGLAMSFVPSLYSPFGISPIAPFKSSFFVSILPVDLSEARYYFKILTVLLQQEVHRKIHTDNFFNKTDYDYIFPIPEMIQ